MLTDEQLTAFAAIRALARTYLDIQDARKRIHNRLLRTPMQHAKQLLLTAEDPYELLRIERLVAKDLESLFANYSPPGIVAWQKRSRGIGGLQSARLLGEIGHPRWTVPHHWEGSGPERHLVAGEVEARSLRELWSYCGHGDPGRRPRKGATAEDLFAAGNPTAKMVVHLIAVQCVKAGGDGPGYRRLYDLARVKYAEATHSVPCVRCGPGGHPAPEGSLWNPGHQHAGALRLLGKRILRDLWVAAGE